MKVRLALLWLWLSCCGVASAHRLDEYLQATLIAVSQHEVQLSMRLIPGIAVSSDVIASIDSNHDGVISADEQRSYAERVLGDVVLSVDGERITPRLVSVEFPAIEQMREGLGEIHVEAIADLPEGGARRRLILESRSQQKRSVYLANALVPSDPMLRIVALRRNETQSFYEMDYTRGPGAVGEGWWSSLQAGGFASLFRLGMRHIAEGTDHLLFLLVLLLPAPLLVAGRRWRGVVGVRQSLIRILKIVTAFTVGHSITLAMGALGYVHVPSKPVEVLIAVSIFVSAVHALRPIFPGREAWIAAFFGLIHGLAFASTLGSLGLGWWERVSGILAFNLGIEAMQMIVVVVTLPSLLLLSRTLAYPWFRVGGAVFAGVVSAGWIVERTLGVGQSVDGLVGALARHSVWIAAGLFVLSAGCWWLLRPDTERPVRHDVAVMDGATRGRV